MTEPGTGLRLDTLGRGAVPGQMVTNVGDVAFIAVTFITTALTPVAGTPPRPAICTWIDAR